MDANTFPFYPVSCVPASCLPQLLPPMLLLLLLMPLPLLLLLGPPESPQPGAAGAAGGGGGLWQRHGVHGAVCAEPETHRVPGRLALGARSLVCKR